MFDMNTISIANEEIKVYLDDNKTKKVQALIDEMSVMASLFGYEIDIDNKPSAKYSSITFTHQNQDKTIAIYFQHAYQKTSCYCLYNGEQISISNLRKLI